MTKEEALSELSNYPITNNVYTRVSDQTRHIVTKVSVSESIPNTNDYKVYVSFIPKVDPAQHPIVEDIDFFLRNYKSI